jgi:Fur family peroxide stress response transcriptional regulator
MNAITDRIRNRLVEKGLKITPQRIAILEAIYNLDNHPSAEMILDYIKDANPGIATGTVYKVLDVLVEHRLVDRVKTEKDIMRYDGILEKHHHLYSSDSEEIMDYENNELDQLLREYFNNNAIKDFEIEGIRLQISGRFLKPGSSL